MMTLVMKRTARWLLSGKSERYRAWLTTGDYCRRLHIQGVILVCRRQAGWQPWEWQAEDRLEIEG